MNYKDAWIAVLLLGLLIGLGSCVVSTNSQTNGGANIETKTAQDGLDYSIVEIEGMPCLILKNSTHYAYTVNSVTCDWRLYKGK